MGTAPRRYASPRREQQAAQTRASVLDAAVELFGERGWTGTGVRDVARQAGVSVETVYSAFGSKVGLFKAALEVSVVGDLAQVPLAERPEFARIGAGAATDRAAAAAALVRQINERVSGLRDALREGAYAEPELATLLTELERRRTSDVRRGARMLAGEDVADSVVGGLWAVVSVEVFQLLTAHAGWSADHYEVWLADTIGRLLAPAEGK